MSPEELEIYDHLRPSLLVFPGGDDVGGLLRQGDTYDGGSEVPCKGRGVGRRIKRIFSRYWVRTWLAR